MRLKITELPGAFEELNALLLSNSKISVDNKQVQSSIFYQAVQNATSLNASEPHRNHYKFLRLRIIL